MPPGLRSRSPGPGSVTGAGVWRTVVVVPSPSSPSRFVTPGPHRAGGVERGRGAVAAATSPRSRSRATSTGVVPVGGGAVAELSVLVVAPRVEVAGAGDRRSSTSHRRRRRRRRSARRPATAEVRDVGRAVAEVAEDVRAPRADGAVGSSPPDRGTPPAAIAAAGPPRPVTATGSSRFVVVPSPSSPLSLLPHATHGAVGLQRVARVVRCVAATCCDARREPGHGLRRAAAVVGAVAELTRVVLPPGEDAAARP